MNGYCLSGTSEITRLAKLREELRKIVDYGLAEQIEETVNELGGEQLDRAVVLAFREGCREGRAESHDEDPAN